MMSVIYLQKPTINSANKKTIFQDDILNIPYIWVIEQRNHNLKASVIQTLAMAI